MRPVLILSLLLMLAGCDEPMIGDSDVIRTAADPAYTYGEGGGVVPSSCSGRASSYSGTAPSCQRDLIFARQVENVGDLVDPRPAGLPSAGPVGRAANAYNNPGSSTASGPDIHAAGTPQWLVTGSQNALPPSDPYAGQGS